MLLVSPPPQNGFAMPSASMAFTWSLMAASGEWNLNPSSDWILLLLNWGHMFTEWLRREARGICVLAVGAGTKHSTR